MLSTIKGTSDISVFLCVWLAKKSILLWCKTSILKATKAAIKVHKHAGRKVNWAIMVLFVNFREYGLVMQLLKGNAMNTAIM